MDKTKKPEVKELVAGIEDLFEEIKKRKDETNEYQGKRESYGERS